MCETKGLLRDISEMMLYVAASSISYFMRLASAILNARILTLAATSVNGVADKPMNMNGSDEEVASMRRQK